jgi:hypothetical protein
MDYRVRFFFRLLPKIVNGGIAGIVGVSGGIPDVYS